MSNEHDVDEKLKPRPDLITIKHQRLAADPYGSAWVSANAGSGKTYVLSTRVIRLLLKGVEPSKILCLTYTKTAAAEMKNRVFSRLGEWVTMDDVSLSKALAEITDKPVGDAQINDARTLFAKALETPGGLKIQTIHAFCEALLHRFPLEANIAGHFELIDDMAAVYLVAEARRQLLTGKGDEAKGAVQRVLAARGEAGLQSLLDEIIGKRQKLDHLIEKLGDTNGARREKYLAAFGFDVNETTALIKQAVWPKLALSLEYMRSVRDEAASLGKSRAYEFAYGYVIALENWQKPDGFEYLRKVALKADGGTYKATYLFAKDILKIFPALLDNYEHDAVLIDGIINKLNLLTEIDQTLDALTIADRLLKIYAKMKRTRGLLDFEDLIARTESMLLKKNVAAWVRYKLDQGIDHILVDEAQDTSPIQWRVIKILADEFFDGEGAREVERTVFAVGDEKQSIYSFQGADPAEFANARDHFSQKLKKIEKPFAPLELEASFRSTGDVLAAVDHVFSYADHKKGIAAAPSIEAQKHRSLRENQPGEVEVWDVEKAITPEPEEDWREPVDHAQKPAIIVANRIAKRIKDWLDNGERLAATGKKIRAGDILVLVRKRDAFVHALSKALKEFKVPVAGADRLQMTQHIAVLDLMALGRVMLNQGDDLSLAALLRSPLFGWSDEQLFDLAYGREAMSLYERLNGETEKLHAKSAYERLENWRVLAVQKPVFEFYSAVLGVGGARAQLIGRLGAEASDMLDAFLNYAIAQERTGPVSLATFINTLDSFGPEIKREMEGSRNEVRIMTVHGAKGLEAPIVFLIDPGSAAFNGNTAPMLLPCPIEDEVNHPIDAVLWAGASNQKSQVATQILEILKEKAIEEYNRLLYVGMTRAADRLIVAGYGGVKETEGTWRDMVHLSLAQHSAPIDCGDFNAIKFPAVQQLASHAVRGEADQKSANEPTIPTCFAAPAPEEPPAQRPLMPSGASGLAIEADRQDSDGEVPASLLEQFRAGGDKYEMSPALAAKRGTLIHKLLQMLPDIEADQRQARAEQYCRNIDHRWSVEDIEAMLSQVFDLLDNPAYAAFFANNALAEVSIMGTVKIADVDQAVSGVIDRLVVTDECVYIIDYKTNANPPRGSGAIPDVYLRQMALYEALVAPLYPNKSVKTALLFTATPQLFVLESAVLANALTSMNAIQHIVTR